MKRHFATATGTACNRGKVTTENTNHVTCLLCQATPLFGQAKTISDAAKAAAFEAQTPIKVREPWHQEATMMVCKACANDTFRYLGRTCYGHYENHVCALCGHVESRLTETGMSF